jgi:hypothetical protein
LGADEEIRASTGAANDLGVTIEPSGRAEGKLIEALHRGEICSLRDEPSALRGQFLRAVLLRKEKSADAAPLQILDARIEGELDLFGGKIEETVLFSGCEFDARIYARDLRCGTLLFQDCRFAQGVVLTRVKATGSIYLRGCKIRGGLDLSSADIAGDLALNGARLRDLDGCRLFRMRVGGSLFLSDGFNSAATVQLDRSQVRGSLIARRAVFGAQPGPAVDMQLTTIDGSADFFGSAFCPRNGVALEGEGMRTGQFLSFANSRIRGRLRMAGAAIGANLTFVGSRIEPPGLDQDPAWTILADTVRIGGHLRLDSVRCMGGASFAHATVGAGINLRGLTLIAKSGRFALLAESAKVGGNVFIGPLDEPARLPVRILGRVSFTSADIGQSFLTEDASFEEGEGDPQAPRQGHDILLNRMRIGAVLRLCGARFHGQAVTLANTRAGSLSDDLESWDTAGELTLNGLEYGVLIGEAPTGWRERAAWLQRQSGDDIRVHPRPQPFHHLASVLRRMGHEHDARMISILRRRFERQARSPLSLRRWGAWVLDATCGYGYRPWLALLWVLWLAGAGVVIFGSGGNGFIPVRDRAYLTPEWVGHRQLPAGYPVFDPVIYSLDLLIPFANFGQKDFWSPTNTGSEAGRLSYYYRPAHMLLGWFFTTIFVGAVTGIIKRE